MTTQARQHPTLIDAAGAASWSTRIMLVVLGALALWASAKIHVPFYPVPMTFQSMLVVVIGMAYGPRLGAATVLLYLAQGALGMPVFSGTPERGVGLAYMLGPTGGYLIGFVVAAAAAGWLAERGFGRSIASTVLAMSLGTALIYVPGLLWLGALIGWDKPILDLGFWPFLIADLAKLLLAAIMMPSVWALFGRIMK